MSDMASKFTKELKNKWLAALRSGEYKQGQDYLCKINKDGSREYCCLGVLAEVSELYDKRDIGGPGEIGYVPKDHSDYNGEMLVFDNNDNILSPIEQSDLASMNDQGTDFVDIANYIEENVKAWDE